MTSGQAQILYRVKPRSAKGERSGDRTGLEVAKKGGWVIIANCQRLMAIIDEEEGMKSAFYQLLKLRAESGIPYWSGWRRGR